MEIKVKLEINYYSLAERLQLLFPEKSEWLTVRALSEYHRDREDYEDVVYSQEQLRQSIDQLLIDFVAESCEVSRLDAETAIAVQMPIARLEVK